MKKSAIYIIKLWIKDQHSLKNVPNNDQQQKKGYKKPVFQYDDNDEPIIVK
jgi:hypothetical protein